MKVTNIFPIILTTLLMKLTCAVNQTRPICYSGSALYQKIAQNCNDKDPAYSGEWYCATVEICESFISKERQCVETRGCATKEECSSSSSTSGYYNGNKVQVTSGINPAGMTITATCCQANNFPDDDSVAVDYTDICNDASRTAHYAALITLVGVAFLYFAIV
mmetsp:Transcript_19543/g.39460  ORF Transcript_19543/g.39460 Transcript_19543/m.39460 type:complete len:163 (-) Transcript_19543:32-520(-)|eukprot:CAMPEP_0170400340 /NCGR_PEP_ID=MMETSP0117_2-20130122/24451_1 /TAXON_ID=400756 /ORGANISM="Durinskia baltica, Strain CSIRO CS-38" /LENGTH=162 /DNA_ID=CAMNT_0010657093 /DNA_START=71 /DNA_END=559 /DNA_ORIENTATION=-